jgi:hypothetical protein
LASVMFLTSARTDSRTSVRNSHRQPSVLSNPSITQLQLEVPVVEERSTPVVSVQLPPCQLEPAASALSTRGSNRRLMMIHLQDAHIKILFDKRATIITHHSIAQRAIRLERSQEETGIESELESWDNTDSMY